MCYKKPGPRCSAWAKKRLDELESTRVSLRDPEAYEKHKHDLMVARLDCDATPGGQKYLRARLAQGNDYDGRYAERLENGIRLRQMQLDAVKVMESGDMFNHDVDSPFHTTPDFPESFTDARRGWTDSSEGKENVEEYMKASDNAMNHLTPEEQSGLWWITSDGGPYLNPKLTDGSKISDKWNMSESVVGNRPGYTDEFLAEKQQALDSAFSKHRLSSPANLYRGLGEWSLPKELDDGSYSAEEQKTMTIEYLHDRYPVGETIEIGEYMSTSADPGRANSFTHWRNQVVLEVQTRSAIPVGRLSAWKSSEREYVVNRGGRYRVEAIQSDVPYATEGHQGRERVDSVTVVRLVEVDEG